MAEDVSVNISKGVMETLSLLTDEFKNKEIKGVDAKETKSEEPKGDLIKELEKKKVEKEPKVWTLKKGKNDNEIISAVVPSTDLDDIIKTDPLNLLKDKSTIISIKTIKEE